MAEGMQSPSAAPSFPAPEPGSMTRPVPPSRGRSPLEELEYESEAQRAVAQWIRENQTLAVLGGFALGVFLGVLMRS